jgi:phytoene/squalene synthetase
MLEMDSSTPGSSLDARIRFHRPHLERVSRSFAFGIARLEPRLRASVGLGYLICRILDTVEDARWPSSEEQLRSFSEFEKFMTSFGGSGGGSGGAAVREWASRFPESISDGERLLLDDAAKVFAEFASLSAGERSAMLKPILSMSRGMAAYASRGRELRLRDLVDVNVYCFFVAGVVGELLTGLVADRANEETRPIGLKSFTQSATHFGLFLQKINVLKDQPSDEAEGRFLVPDRARMFASLRENAFGAFAYLRAIPLERRDYRLFCAWALFLGLATVPYLRAGGTKLSRVQAMALGARIEFAIQDNDRLQALFDEGATAAWPATELASAAAGAAGDSAVAASRGETFARARAALVSSYSGRFDLDELASLLAKG